MAGKTNFHSFQLEDLRSLTNLSINKAKSVLKLQGRDDLTAKELARVSGVPETDWQGWLDEGTLSLDKVPLPESLEDTVTALVAENRKILADMHKLNEERGKEREEYERKIQALQEIGICMM